MMMVLTIITYEPQHKPLLSHTPNKTNKNIFNYKILPSSSSKFFTQLPVTKNVTSYITHNGSISQQQWYITLSMVNPHNFLSISFNDTTLYRHYPQTPTMTTMIPTGLLRQVLVFR